MDNIWFEKIFDWCVKFLLNAADTIGITYEALNVWVFVIIVPVVLLISVVVNFYLIWSSGRHECGLPELKKKLIHPNPYIKTMNG